MTSVIDMVIIIAYLAIVVCVGLITAKRKNISNKEDYLLAGRSLSLPVYMCGLTAVVIGGGTTTLGAQFAYQKGISAIWIGILTAIGIFLLGFLMSTKLSKMRIFTTNEAVGVFYGKGARVMSAIATTVYLFFAAVLQTVAIGTVINTMMNIDFSLSMIIGAAIILVYLFVGGMWSVAITDVIQIVVMTVGVIIIAPAFGLVNVGGITELFSKLPNTHFDMLGIGGGRVLGYIFALIPGYLIGQDVWQRCFSAKSTKIAKRGAILSSLYILLYASATVIIGLCLYAAGVHLDEPSTAFSAAVATFVPIGLRGVVLSALVAAILSSANGAILGTSSVIYSDIFEVFHKKEASEKQKVWSLRILCAIIVVLVTFTAVALRSIVSAGDIAYTYLASCLCIPLISALLLKKVSAKAGLAGIATGFVTATTYMLIKGEITISATVPAMILCALVFFTVNAFDKNKKVVDLDAYGVDNDGQLDNIV